MSVKVRLAESSAEISAESSSATERESEESASKKYESTVGIVSSILV